MTGLEHIDLMLEKYKELSYLKQPIIDTCNAIEKAYNNGNKIMVCGNGGSSSDSEHIVGELMKGFLLKRPISQDKANKIKEMGFDNSDKLIKDLQQGIPAISLGTHSTLISALINDIDADMMYAQQVYSIGVAGDILIGMSTSGNAHNVLNALKLAKAFGMTTIGLTGNRNGNMNTYCDILLDAPSCDTYRIQEYHLAIYHAFCAAVEADLFI